MAINKIFKGSAIYPPSGGYVYKPGPPYIEHDMSEGFTHEDLEVCHAYLRALTNARMITNFMQVMHKFYIDARLPKDEQ